jgi:anti-sigma regulatory factor (Ser/Thr protein kinase)
LAESQKLDALGQLTGGVAHDFNNLLMIIAGNLLTIRKEVTTEKSLRAVQSIDTASQRAAALTRQLLTFARRQSVRPQPIALAERLILMKDMMNSGLGSSVSLAIDAAPDVGTIEVDASEFETALVNLVINARDAMPEGGTVVVGAKNKGDFIEVSVEDSGVGIPPDILDKVFDPFFTTKPIGKGTGLGLSQVHGFSHQAGGTIRIESQMGEGTTITMSFPRSRATENETAADITVAQGMGTILLVEDNSEVADATTGMIEQLGYNVRYAPDAMSALREIENEGIDIVFSDIVMPGWTASDWPRVSERNGLACPSCSPPASAIPRPTPNFRSSESPISFTN